MHILTFTLRNELFAVDAMAVKEIVWLPELTPVEEVPDYIAGVFNLRGHIVPVMDLNIRLGHEQERYQVTDRVIVIAAGSSELGVRREENPPVSPFFKGGAQEIPPLAKGGEGGFGDFGIIVSDVHDVVAVSERDIEPTLTLRPLPEGEGTLHLIAGEVKVGEEIIMLLDHTAIAETPSPQSPPVKGGEIKGTPSPLAGEGRGEGAFLIVTPEELTIFHARALTLMQPPEEVVVEGSIPLAVVSLNGEYFGVDLEVIKEFANIRGVTPVPCTPAHIVGDMNLRGDILTIVDIGGMLNLRSAEFGMRNAELTKEKHSALRTPHSAFEKKAVISQVNDLVAGVTVDDVIEVINVGPSDVRPVPASVEAVGNEYIKGEFPYQGKMLSILDMKKVLMSKEMAVEE